MVGLPHDCCRVWARSTTVAPAVAIASYSVRLPAVARARDAFTTTTCSDPTNCFMVGYEQTSGGINEEPVIESWNGTSWSLVPNNPPNAQGDLESISCGAPTSCEAAGYGGYREGNGASIATWNGSSWSGLGGGGDGSYYNSISCISAAFCIASGQYYDETQISKSPWRVPAAQCPPTEVVVV